MGRKSTDSDGDIVDGLVPGDVGGDFSRSSLVFAGGKGAGLVVLLGGDHSNLRVPEEFKPVITGGYALIFCHNDDSVSLEGNATIFVGVEQSGCAPETAGEGTQDVGNHAAAAPAFNLRSFPRAFGRAPLCHVKVIHIRNVQVCDQQHAIAIVTTDN